MADTDLNSAGGYTFNTPAGVAALREKVSTTHDTNRLIRYANNWQFYLGVHWTFTREDGEPLITVNYLAALIDKKIAFLIGNDWTLNVPPVLQDKTVPLIQRVWEDNGRQRLNYEIAQEGGVTGDCFMLVTAVPMTKQDRKSNPTDRYRVVIQRLNAHECFPLWDEESVPTKYGRKMKAFSVVRYFRRQKPGTTKPTDVEDIRYVMTITDDEIQVRMGDEPVKKSPNVLGEIPIVHIQNKVAGRTFFGIDDCSDLIPLNREYNEKSTDISDSINYNAAPITVITGAKAKALERSPRAIWSNLPVDAQVFHLKLEGELIAAVSYLERTKKAMHEIAGVPEGSLGQLQPITGTSGETLNMTMAPLVDERNKKRATYEPGFERVNYFVLRMHEEMNHIRLPFGLCERCGGRIAIFYEDDPEDTATDQELKAWDNGIDLANGEPFPKGRERYKIELRKCYLADPETFDFLDPLEVEIPIVREHSFGQELTKVPLAQAAAEHGMLHVSMYDPADEEPRNPEPEMVAEGGQPPVEQPLPQLNRKAIKLPKEPETFDLPEVSVQYDDGTEETVQVARSNITAIPTDCRQHTFLSPYTNWVTFNDTLPKDKAGQAQLLLQYQALGVVSKAWMMAQIGIENVDEMTEQIRQEGASSQQSSPGGPPPSPPQSSGGGGSPADTQGAEISGPGSEPASASQGA